MWLNPHTVSLWCFQLWSSLLEGSAKTRLKTWFAKPSNMLKMTKRRRYVDLSSGVAFIAMLCNYSLFICQISLFWNTYKFDSVSSHKQLWTSWLKICITFNITVSSLYWLSWYFCIIKLVVSVNNCALFEYEHDVQCWIKRIETNFFWIEQHSMRKKVIIWRIKTQSGHCAKVSVRVCLFPKRRSDYKIRR